MRIINHNWSATKQRPHPQSVAEISRHSVLSRDRIRQCWTSSGSETHCLAVDEWALLGELANFLQTFRGLTELVSSKATSVVRPWPWP